MTHQVLMQETRIAKVSAQFQETVLPSVSPLNVVEHVTVHGGDMNL